MGYTEEIKKEAEDTIEKYIGYCNGYEYCRIVFRAFYNRSLNKKNAIKSAIQDRQSVLDILYKTGCRECQSKNDELVESLAKQIEYLKGKL